MSDYNVIDVLGFIESKLDKTRNETMPNQSFSHVSRMHEHEKITVNSCLPKGCKELNIHENSSVSVVNTLYPNEILEIVNSYKPNLVSGTSISLCIVLLNDPEDRSCFSWRRKYIQFKSFTSWLKKYKTLGIGRTIYSHNSQLQTVIIPQAKNAINSNRISLFIGAGLGASLKLPSWDTLIDRLKANSNDKEEVDTVCDNALIKARFLLGNFTDTDYSNLRNALYSNQDRLDTSDLLDVIGEVVERHIDRIDGIITYNYDDYIERKLGDGKCKAVYGGIRAGNKLPVYHVHGIIPMDRKMDSPSNKKNIVLTETQYHSLYNKAYSWANVEQYHAISRNTCFFIGMSMNDPNLRRLLDAALSESRGSEHYVFMYDKKYSCTSNKRSYHKATKARFVFASTMSSLGVSVIWCNSPDDIVKKISEVFDL